MALPLLRTMKVCGRERAVRCRDRQADGRGTGRERKPYQAQTFLSL